MPVIEIDTLQRVRDMTYTHPFGTGYFRAGRIDSVNVAGQDFLVMASDGDGFGVATIGSNGALDFVDAFGVSYERLEGWAFGSTTIASIEKNGETFVYLSGRARELVDNRDHNESGLLVLKIDADGTPDVLQYRPIPGAPQGYGSTNSLGSDPKIINVGGRDILVSSDNARSSSGGESTFETFQIRANGTLKPLASSQPFVYDFEKNDVVTVDGKAFVIAFGQFDIAPLQVLRLFKTGVMRPVFELPTSDTAIYNRITTDLETVEIGNRSFVIVSEVTAGTILVYEVLPSGRLQLVEQEAPDAGDSWRYSGALEVFEENGDAYVAAASGTGIGVFRISDGGALIQVDDFRPATAMGNNPDLEARDINGSQYLFVSSNTTDEIRSLRYVAVDDSINGNNGANRRKGTAEDDQIYGRGGNDVLRGLDGDDLIEGGNGRDKLVGGDGDDNLFGGARQDKLLGGNGNDFLFGDFGNDILYGMNGNDYLNGGAGDDLVQGGTGNDRLFGAGGNDILKGGDGFDVLTDGAGFDQMTGGNGADIFVFWKDGNRDVIRDYEDNLDRIDLTEFGRDLEFSDLSIRQAGNDVRVRVMGEVIVVKSADGQIFDYELSLGDFVFA